MDQARETEVREVTAGAEDAFEVPDGFGPGVEEQRSAMIRS